MTPLEKLIEELPPELRREVEDFARFLITTRVGSAKVSARQKKLNLSWAGALSDYRDRFTSTDLQKQSLDWWGS